MNGLTKFTIIIPTRERCDTLYYALKTCVVQNYNNCEFIVSDNFSQDKTKETILSFQDSRIKYINTGKRLSMSDNWEFALSHIHDGYVMFLGDDDGLLPNALSNINKIIQEENCDAICWDTVFYKWPNVLDDSQKSILNFPFSIRSHRRIKIESKSMLSQVLSMNESYMFLPKLYTYGMVNYNILREGYGKTGRFFNSMNPDIYSSITIASTVEKYIFSYRPFSVGGISAHSIGASSLNTSFQAKTEIEQSEKISINKFYSEKNIPFHSKLPFVHTTSVLLAESYFQAKDQGVKNIDKYKLKIEDVIRHSLQETRHLPSKQFAKVVDVIKEIAIINEVKNIDSIINLYPNKFLENRKPVIGYQLMGLANIIKTGFSLKKIILIKKLRVPFEKGNIYEAALICDKEINKKLNILQISMSVIKNLFLQFFANRPLFKKKLS
jgi:glycosyltransferase involved in cell wall biosynthesis